MSKYVSTKAKAMQDVAVKHYDATAQEGEGLRKYIARMDERTAPAIKISEDGKKLSIDHPLQRIGFLLVVEALGTTSAEFAIDIIRQLMTASQEGTHFDSVKFKAMVASVMNGKPRNEKEAQMEVLAAITYQAAVKNARQMNTTENVMQRESTQRMHKGLVRSFIDLNYALTRGPAAAENPFTVQQKITVEGGGPTAVITNVNSPAPADALIEPAAATLPALTNATTAPLPLIDEGKARVAIPKRAERYQTKKK